MDDMGRRPTYTESSIAMVREDMLARYKAEDLMKKWRHESIAMSDLEKQFQASKRGGRRNAIMDLSVAAEVSRTLRSELRKSFESGKT